MKQLRLISILVLSITFSYGQNGNQNFSHDGLLEQVFDNYGTSLKLKDVAIMPKKSIVDNSTMLSSNLLLTSGIFEIYFEDGSGMELNNAIHNARRNVINQVFIDISNFLSTPLKNSGNTTKVKIWIRSFGEIAEIVPEQSSYGTSYYNVTKNGSLASIIDSQLWKIINGGKNPYENISNRHYNGTNLKFYHAAFSFNFNQNWNTSLLNKASGEELDLYTQVLREAVHALGFNSLINSEGQSKFGTEYKYYSRFDKYLVNQSDSNLIESSNGSDSMINYDFIGSLSDLDNCGGSANTCSTINKFNGTNQVKLYTPNCFNPNATLQYTDADCNTTLGDYWLMRNGLLEGETQRFMNEYERQILIDLGYGFGDSFGELQYFSLYDYDFPQATFGIVGYNDGIAANSYVFTGNVGDAISLSNLIANDSFTNSSFENLADLTSTGTQFSATSGTFNTNVQVTFNAPGLHLLSYVPYNSVTDQRGNITYVYVIARPPMPCVGLTPDSCNYVSNGNFENHNGFSNGNNFTDVVCLWNTFPTRAGADYFHSDSPNPVYDLPLNSGSSIPNAVNPFAPGTENACIGFSIDRGFNGLNYDYNNEGVFSGLNTVLLPNVNYVLSLHVLKRYPFNVEDSPEIQACLVNSTGVPATQLDMQGNVVFPTGSIFLDQEETIDNDNQWQEVEFTFNSGNIADHNFLYIGSLVNPLINNNQTEVSGAYMFIDNVVLTPVFNPVFNPINNICLNEASFDLNELLTGETEYGVFAINGTPITGSTFDPATVGAGTHTITYTIPDTIACNEIVVSSTIVINSCAVSSPPYISQVYIGGTKSKAVEVKNNDNTLTITPNMYYLVWYQGNGLPANLSAPTASIDLASAYNILPNGVKVFKSPALSNPSYVNTAPVNAVSFATFQGYDGLYDVIIIFTSNGANAYNDRIDALGDNSPVFSVMYKEHTMEEYRSLVRVSCMPNDRQPPQVNYDEQDWVGFNRFGTNATGFFDESTEIAQGTKTNGELGRHFDRPVEWIGSWNDQGITDPTNESNPDRSRTILVNAPYDTTSYGNFEACSLVSNNNLVINATNNVKVQTKVTSSPPTNGVVVQDDGSLVQVRDRFYGLENQELITVNGNNSLKHARTTNGVNHQYDYVYWSSPLSTNTANLPIHSFFPLSNTSGMFNPARFFIYENVNFNDNNGDLYDDHAYTDPYNSNLIDYVPFSVLPNYTTQKFIPGRGYITWPKVGFPTNYTIEFKGEMNNGEVFVPIYNNNSSTGQNPNLVGNPYPSAIDLNILFNVNFDIIEPLAIIWGRSVSDPEVIYPGPDAYNYSEDNYLIYNPTMIIDPAFDTNDSFNSEGILASCQSFFVRATGGTNYVGAGNYLGDLKFSNVMRSTRPNTTFARLNNNKNSVTNSFSSNEGKLWLNLTDNQGYAVQQGIAFLENKNDEFVPDEDIRVVNGRKYNFYSKVANEDVVINLQNVFEDTKVIPLGMTNISENTQQTFTISIPKKEGVFDGQTVYLYDALLDVTHNLSNTSYTFTTTEIVTEDRFYLQFTNETTNLAKQNQNIKEDVTVYSKDGVLTIQSLLYDIKEVNVTDLYHVKEGVKIVASVKQQNTKLVQLDLADDLKLLNVTITLENGTVIHKKIYK